MCRLLLIMNKNANNKLIKKFLLQSISKKNTPNINYKNDCNFHKDGFGFAWKNIQSLLFYSNHIPSGTALAGEDMEKHVLSVNNLDPNGMIQ